MKELYTTLKQLTSFTVYSQNNKKKISDNTDIVHLNKPLITMYINHKKITMYINHKKITMYINHKKITMYINL